MRFSCKCQLFEVDANDGGGLNRPDFVPTLTHLFLESTQGDSAIHQPPGVRPERSRLHGRVGQHRQSRADQRAAPAHVLKRDE